MQWRDGCLIKEDKYYLCVFCHCFVCPQDVFVEFGEEAETNLTSELTDPKHVVPALKHFLEQLTRSR